MYGRAFEFMNLKDVENTINNFMKKNRRYKELVQLVELDNVPRTYQYSTAKPSNRTYGSPTEGLLIYREAILKEIVNKINKLSAIQESHCIASGVISSGKVHITYEKNLY